MKKIGVTFLLCLILVGCEAVFVANISKSKVYLTAPSNNVQVQSGKVRFTWNTVEDADSYVVQIGKPNFSQTQQLVLDTTISTTRFEKELIAGNYEWRVKAVNSAYETQFQTNTLEVTGTSLTTSTLELVSPQNDFVTNIGNVNLVWKAIAGAKEYHVQVWKPDVNGTKVKDIITTNVSTTNAFEDGKFTWRVRAQNDTENSKYTARILTVDTTAPNQPVLKTPVNNSSGTGTTVEFSWDRIAISGTTEIDSIFVYTDAALQTLNFKAKGTGKKLSKVLTSNTYYWFVRSYDQAGNSSAKSGTFSFTIN